MDRNFSFIHYKFTISRKAMLDYNQRMNQNEDEDGYFNIQLAPHDFVVERGKTK